MNQYMNGTGLVFQNIVSLRWETGFLSNLFNKLFILVRNIQFFGNGFADTSAAATELTADCNNCFLLMLFYLVYDFFRLV